MNGDEGSDEATPASQHVAVAVRKTSGVVQHRGHVSLSDRNLICNFRQAMHGICSK